MAKGKKRHEFFTARISKSKRREIWDLGGFPPFTLSIGGDIIIRGEKFITVVATELEHRVTP